MLPIPRLSLPSRETLLASRWLRPFERHLTAPVLWRWNRRSVARGVALGLFFGLLVPLLQMPAAAVFAVAARANLAVAAFCTLVTNPLTTPAIYFAAYQLGTALIHVEAHPGHASDGWLDRALAWLAWLAQASLPTALGLSIFSVTAAGVGYGAVQLIWRWRVARRWRQRAMRRAVLGN